MIFFPVIFLSVLHCIAYITACMQIQCFLWAVLPVGCRLIQKQQLLIVGITGSKKKKKSTLARCTVFSNKPGCTYLEHCCSKCLYAVRVASDPFSSFIAVIS